MFVGYGWKKSNRSGPNGACVLARKGNGGYQIGDSKVLAVDMPSLTVSASDWDALRVSVRK